MEPSQQSEGGGDEEGFAFLKVQVMSIIDGVAIIRIPFGYDPDLKRFGGFRQMGISVAALSR